MPTEWQRVDSLFLFVEGLDHVDDCLGVKIL